MAKAIRLTKYDVGRKQRYVEKLFIGMSPEAAAVASGFCDDGVKAKTVVAYLGKDPYVQDLVVAHRQELAERFRFDRDKATEQLEDARQLAMLTGDAKGAVAAIKETAEIHGLHPQRGGQQVNVRVSAQGGNSTAQSASGLDALSSSSATEAHPQMTHNSQGAPNFGRLVRKMSDEELFAAADVVDAEYVVLPTQAESLSPESGS